MEMGSKGPLQKNFCVKKDFCVKKKGPKKDYFSSLVLKRTKSLIKDLYASTAWGASPPGALPNNACMTCWGEPAENFCFFYLN